MIARIDSKDKTIAIEEQVTIDELVKFLKFVDPTGWKEWKVNTNVKFEITSAPIVIREYPSPYIPIYPPPYPNQPWYSSAGICQSNGANTVIDGQVCIVDFQTQG